VNRGSGLRQGCGQRRFATRIAAEKALERGAELPGGTESPGEPLECESVPSCGGWHLPDPPKERRAGRPRDTGPDARTRELVLRRDSWACVCCGRSVIGHVYSLQHRKRRSQGGKNLPSNLITVLGDGTTGCHSRIDSRIDSHDEASGYTVRSGQNPAHVGVMVHGEQGGMQVWLDDSGNYLDEDGRVVWAPGAAA
jgi:hypothetical protein